MSACLKPVRHLAKPRQTGLSAGLTKFGSITKNGKNIDLIINITGPAVRWLVATSVLARTDRWRFLEVEQ